LFGKGPPRDLNEHLLGHVIAGRIQAKFLPRQDKVTLRAVTGSPVARSPRPATEPRLRPGTVPTRGARGACGTRQPSSAGGFAWQDRTDPSISAVARAITGTSWNGRLFGLWIASRHRNLSCRQKCIFVDGV
jgi:hypothetical protein